MSRKSARRGFARGLGQGVVAILLIAFLAIAIGVGVVPRALGGAALTVLTGSMEPTYDPGDIVVSVPKDSYAVGDAVTFQPHSGDPALITHRVVGVHSGSVGTGYVTRGDANGGDDDPIVEAQVMGKVIYSIPKLGYAQQLLGSNRAMILTIIGLGLLTYAGYALVSVGVERLRRATADPGRTHRGSAHED